MFTNFLSSFDTMIKNWILMTDGIYEYPLDTCQTLIISLMKPVLFHENELINSVF